jgi:hypothetical protein
VKVRGFASDIGYKLVTTFRGFPFFLGFPVSVSAPDAPTGGS